MANRSQMEPFYHESKVGSLRSFLIEDFALERLVTKFGHIESEEVIVSEQIMGEFQSQSGLPTP
jgi:hypothetical protein